MNDRPRLEQIETTVAFERALLGAAMLYAEVLPVALALKGTDFHKEAHRLIHAAIAALAAREAEADNLAVAGELADRGRLDEAGGRSYLGLLLDEAAVPSSAPECVARIRDASMKRALERLRHQLVAEAWNGRPAGELVRIVETEIGDLTAAGRAPGAGHAWQAAQPAPHFLAAEDPTPDFLEARLLAPGSITEWFSPRGLGKTHGAHALMVKHARLGKRVLLIDRDNARREVRRRLRGWGAETATTLHVLTRDGAPAMTDTAAWRAFPFDSYDLIVVDSIDAATEGVGENDSAKPAAALAPLLDIARREAGPAILILGNVVKSGAHGRGSGVVEDRADIVYEVRDATEFQPSGQKPWWLELPPSGRDAWAERAVRRRRRDRYRLALIPSKFRIGEEPDPFILEVDLSAEPWQLRDVTAAVEAAGQVAVQTAAADRAARIEAAAGALAARVQERVEAGAPLTMTEAETVLTAEYDLRQREARRLVATGAGWRVETDRTRRGHPRLLFPVTHPSDPGKVGVTTRDIDEKPRRSESVSSVTRENSGRRETGHENPAPDAAIQNRVFSRHAANQGGAAMADEKAPTWEEV